MRTIKGKAVYQIKFIEPIRNYQMNFRIRTHRHIHHISAMSAIQALLEAPRGVWEPCD
jgi:hypothetical protein